MKCLFDRFSLVLQVIDKAGAIEGKVGEKDSFHKNWVLGCSAPPEARDIEARLWGLRQEADVLGPVSGPKRGAS